MNTVPTTPTLSSELKLLIEQRNVLTTRTKSKVIRALDTQIKEDREAKKSQLKARAIEEIFTSEVSYLNQLELAMKYFKKPLVDSKLQMPDNLKSLFDNLESVYNVNGELLNQLRQHGEDVAGAFITVAPFFKLYSVYAYEYRHGLSALQSIQKTNGKLDAFIKKQETRPEVCMKLGSLLIAPIQRIPRYRLLLKELLNYTPKNHPHHFSIIEAIKEVEVATEHINTLVSEQENMERIIELQKSLVGNNPILVHPGRKLIKEGTLMKMSKKGKKAHSRYFILMSDVIVYCKTTGAMFGEANSLRCSCVLPLKKCLVQHSSTEKLFQIICSPVTLFLFSEEAYATEAWVASITQAIHKEQQNQQTLKRKGSGRHLRKKDTNSISDPLTPKKRKQLEIRSQIVESCTCRFGESLITVRPRGQSLTTSECTDAIAFHSPWKRNKTSVETSSNMDSSSEAEEFRPKRTGYFSSFKKAISSFGHSFNKYWIPMYARRDDRRLTD